tara:strand:- start:54 stop:1361 length:1308 start_codon:yes stop_codon:yes gene_type:complete
MRSSGEENRSLTAPNSKERKLFVYLTCLFIVTWYLQLGLRVGVLGAIRFEFILGAFLSVSALLTLLNEKRSTPLKGPIIFFFSVLAFYTLFSYDRSHSWETFFNRVIKFSMLAAFLAAFVRTEWALKMVIAAFLLAMLKMGQEGLIGWLTGGMVWENQGIPRLHGVTGLYRHPNSYSGMAVGCLPFIYYLYPTSNWWQKSLLIALLACALIIIVFTGSRTGYVATILLSIYFWREKLKVRRAKYLLVGIAVFVTAYALLPEAYTERLHSIITLEEAQGSSSETRIQILKDAVSVFISRPWGVGVSAFPSVRYEMFGRIQDTHNLYLELLTNMSVLGVLSFFVFVGTIVRQNKIIIARTNSPFVDAVAQAVIAFIYARLFLGLFGMDTYEIYWWFAAGLTMGMYRITSNHCKKDLDTTTKFSSIAQAALPRRGKES